MLDDEPFMDEYITYNTTALKESYNYLVTKLAAVGIRTIPAVSSIFAFVDMRPLLVEHSFDGEKKLFDTLAARLALSNLSRTS